MNSELMLSYVAGAAVPQRTLVKFGADAQHVVPAAAATDSIIGTSLDVDAALGDRCEVGHSFVFPVLAGGAITPGDKVTSDGSGRAILLVAGAGVRQAGIALTGASGAGVLVQVLITLA